MDPTHSANRSDIPLFADESKTILNSKSLDIHRKESKRRGAEGLL